MSSYQYLKTFFREKDLKSTVYTVESRDGTTNILCTEDVILALLEASGDIQDKAASILRTIDMANGDVGHFLRYVAQGLAVDLTDF